MVQYSQAGLDATFGALADATRRAILAQLARGETSVTRLSAQFDISLPGVLKHVRVLETAGLLRSTKEGRVRRCRLEVKPLRSAAEWMEFYQQFWDEQLDSLAEYLENTADTADDKGDSWPHKQQAHQPPSASRGRSRRRWSASSTRGPSRKK